MSRSEFHQKIVTKNFHLISCPVI